MAANVCIVLRTPQARAAAHPRTHALMYPRKPDAALAPSCAVYAISRYVSAATTTGYPSRSKLRNQLPRIQVRRISKTPTSIPRKLRSREDLVG